MERSVFHRSVAHNLLEMELVKTSMEVWGKEGRTLSGGISVRAYPGKNTTPSSYSFTTLVTSYREHYGFRSGQKVVREVSWTEGSEGVVYRVNEKYVAISIDWFDECSMGKNMSDF